MSYKIKLSKLFSLMGHPLLIGPVYVILMSFNNLPCEIALKVSLITVGIIALPIVIHNLRKLKKGEYSNFDVSDQKQRKGFYPFAISLFCALIITFYFFDFPFSVISNTLNFLIMMIIMNFLNIKIKASLHAGVASYISLSLFSISNLIGICFLILAMATTWSRLILKRHTPIELITGMLIGLVFGFISLFL